MLRIAVRLGEPRSRDPRSLPPREGADALCAQCCRGSAESAIRRRQGMDSEYAITVEQRHDGKPARYLGDRNQNPPGIRFGALLREDLEVHDHLLDPGFLVIAVHRFGNWRMGIRPRLLRRPFSLLYKILELWTRWSCGVTLPYTVKLGRRLHLSHCAGIVIHAHSIGDDVHIRQHTTMGIARRDALYQLPTIEDRVDIGCGAVILGQVTVGHDSVIGANAVVLKDVPPRSVAVGVPARVVKTLP